MLKKPSYKEAVLRMLKEVGKVEDNTMASVKSTYDYASQQGRDLIDFADKKLSEARELLQEVVRNLPGE